MEEFDVLQYADKWIEGLTEDNFFCEENVFMEKDLLRLEIIKAVELNITEDKDPFLTDDQFMVAVENAFKQSVDDTFDSLISKGLIDIAGMDNEDKFVYKLSKKFV